MFNKVYIKPNSNEDTRTAIKPVSFKEFHEANVEHIKDVKKVMRFLGNKLIIQGINHDHTKLSYEDEFYDNFLSVNDGVNFLTNTWYQKHIQEEKHHPFSYCHEDINLLDIIETIADCVCAGKARSGEVRPIEFNNEILKKAVANTVKLIDEMTEVKEK